MAWADEIIELGDDDISIVVQSDQATVTKDNFYDYFNSAGSIKTTTPQTIIFKGSFEGLPVDTISIDEETTIKSDNAYFKNVCFQTIRSRPRVTCFTELDTTARQPGK